MKKLFHKVMDVLQTVGATVTSWTYLHVIKDSFADLMPLIIGGSFAALINNVLCSTKNGIAQFETFAFLEKFSPAFSAINYATMNFLAIFLVVRIAMKLAETRRISEITAGFIALACYISMVPTFATGLSSTEEAVKIGNVIASNYTNSQGMFFAIIIGIASTEMLSKLIHWGKLEIKMPDSVPPGVSRAFAALFPCVITIFAFAIIGTVFNLATGQYIPDFITTVLQKPMEGIMQHPAGVIVLALCCQLFWMLGIHGTQMINPVRNTIGLAAIAANLAAYEAGQPLPNVFTYTFWNTYVTIGGGGCTLGLIIAIYLFSTREDYRAIAKLSTVPGIFNINEPMIFGMPIVLNPILAIPFILTPMITASIGYIATATGFAGAAYITVPFTVPPIINVYLSTGGSIGAVITQIICIAVSAVMYIPFVKILNKQEVNSVAEQN